VFDELARRHRAAVAALVVRRRVQTRKQVDALLAELGSTLQGIHLLRHCPLRALDMTASFGERLSALIVAAYVNRFHPAICVDARTFVRTDDQFTHAAVDFPATNRLARSRLGSWLRKRQPPIPIVTGSARPTMGRRPPSGGTARITARRLSARPSARTPSRSGPTSTAC
jgi:aspartokinase